MSWQEILKTNFTQLDKLADFLQFDDVERQQFVPSPTFRLNLPLRLAQKIQKKNLLDPILRQFVPLIEEKRQEPGFIADPVSDQSFQKKRKLLHKYTSRTLILTTSACAMHCRYCFRQNFTYEKERKEFAPEIEYIKTHTEIEEVILSGGDPLSLSDRKLQDLITQLQQIKHVKRLRLHTRFVIGIPERITEEFLRILESTHLQVWFVIHCNHPKELDEDVLSALKKIQKLGIPVLNQWILLKGVNDQFAIQKELCQALINQGVMPYYLHKLDPVKQAWHFAVPDSIGKQIMQQLQEHLSGYGVPKFVQEIPFEKSKTIL